MAEQSFPRWILVYIWFVSLVSIAFSVVIYTNPTAMWGHWPASGAEGAFDLAGPAGLFCARNLGAAALGIYAAVKGSRAMIESFLVFRIVVDLLDGTHAFIGGNTPIIVIGFAAAALQALIFVKLKSSETA